MCFFHQQANKHVGDGDFVNTWSCKDFQGTQYLFNEFMRPHCYIILIFHPKCCTYSPYASFRHSLGSFLQFLLLFVSSFLQQNPPTKPTTTSNQPSSAGPPSATIIKFQSPQDLLAFAESLFSSENFDKQPRSVVDLDVDGNAQRLIRSLDVMFVDMSMAVMGGEGEDV